MKKNLILILAVILLAPGLVFSDMVTFKVGYFIPRAKSDLWEIEFENMTFNRSNYQNTNFSFSYEYFLAREISIVLGIDTYYKNKAGTYLDYVGETIDGFDYAFDYGEGLPISHVFNVSITPIQLSLKLTPMGRREKFIPYVGGGVGLYIWSVRLQGDMIDFSDEEIFYDPSIDENVIGLGVYPTDAREENRLTFGYHAFGGIMIPMGRRITIDVEFKYNIVKGNFSDDPEIGFEGFAPFDLGGYQISVGFNYWF